MEIAKENYAHVMTTDKAHEQMREQMTNPGKGPQGRVVGVVQQRMGQEKRRALVT